MAAYDETNLTVEELVGAGDVCVNCSRSMPTEDTGYGSLCTPCDEDLERYFTGDPDALFFADDGFAIEMHDDGPRWA